MSTTTNPAADFPLEPGGFPPVAAAETRPMYWSIRRELWENRSLYIAPLIVAAIVLFASLVIVAGTAPSTMRKLPTLSESKQRSTLNRPFEVAPAPIMLTTIIVGLFYSLDALYGERRDRSILFWKSLPVSDATTVLSKMAIPMVVLPSIGFLLSVVAQFIVLAQYTTVLTISGISAVPVWREFELFPDIFVMIYGLGVHALWYSPIYAWFLLISAWARRTPFLWAILPVFVISVVEKITSNSSHFLSFLKYRAMGAMSTAVTTKRMPGGHDMPVSENLSDLTPLRFLSTPGLWLGLIFAAICVAAAIRLRRSREPI